MQVKVCSRSGCVGSGFVKNLPLELCNFILKLFNKIFNLNNFLPLWKEYFVIFIPKAGSGKFRPISLANTLFKIFEKITYYRLSWWCKCRSLIPEFQFRFCRAKSVDDSLAILFTEIRLAFTRISKLGTIFLDIKGAFDNVNPILLIEILNQLGLRSKIVRFIHSVISERYLSGYIDGNFIDRKKANCGLPQGSSLSPILYSLYTAFLTRGLPEDVSVLYYADDIVVYTSSVNLQVVFNRLQSAYIYFHLKLKKLQLELSGAKSKLCIFSKHERIKDSNMIRRLNLKVAFQGESVPIVKTVKFLGVIFDGKLSWVAHAKQVLRSSGKKINVMRSIAGLCWGSHPSTLLSVYKGWIRSSLEYGSIAFVDIDHNAEKILDTIQFRALRIVLSLFISTPTNIILHLIGEMPLRIRRRLLTDRKIRKLLNLRKEGSLLLNLLDRPNYRRSVSVLEGHRIVILSTHYCLKELFMRICLWGMVLQASLKFHISRLSRS